MRITANEYFTIGNVNKFSSMPRKYLKDFRLLNWDNAILAIFFFLAYGSAAGQKIPDVNLSTGTVHVSLPVYNISRGAVSVPISLEYYATGIQIGQLQSVLGTGWNLNAGGSISRTVRDLPDDIKTDLSSNSRVGWLYNSNATKINNFTIANDNNQSTCNDETTDINYITNNFSDNSDVEPDIFNVSAPGLNCQIVYDQVNAVFRPIPYQDITISYSLNANSNSIISFIITDQNGIQYNFSTPESVTQTASSSIPGRITYLARAYNLYKNGITYNQKWYLTKITDANGNYVAFTYVNNLTTINISAPISVTTSSTNSNSTTTNLYSTQLTYNPLYVSTVYSYNKLTNLQTNDGVSFNYTTTNNIAAVLLKSIYVNGGQRILTCGYNKVVSTTRDYLTSFGESGCYSGGITYNSNLYGFAYNGVNFSGPSPIADTRFDGAYQDPWGYPNNNNDGTFGGPWQIYVYPPNPSFPNLERYRFYPVPNYTGTSYTIIGSLLTSVDPTVTSAVLSQIIYPTGGTRSFTYQPNDYYDVSAGVTNQGGGVRVSQITDYDGISTNNNIIRNYYYLNPATGYSSGKAIGMPSLAFTVPYNGGLTGAAYWDTSTVRLASSYSNQNETIIYGSVKVTQTGAGSSVYTFSTPGTFFDLNAQPVSGGSSDWVPTNVFTGRLISGGSCPITGALINGKYNYPFPPNINYDFERSIPLSVTAYNDAGQIVSQINYTYTRSYPSAIPITAIKFDHDSSSLGYAKYQIYCYTSELFSVVSKSINDLNNLTNNTSQQISSTTKFSYAGVNHRLPTIIETDNTDGSISREYIKYTKDFTYSQGETDDPTVTSIKSLVGLNVNTPIENYYSLTRSGVEMTMKADLVKFAPFSSGVASPANIYLPSQRLKYISSAGIANFTPAYNNAGTFTNFSGYFVVENITAYNPGGQILAGNDNFKNVSSQLVDDVTHLTVAKVTNANLYEALYSNFEGIELKYGLTGTNCTYNNSISRTGNFSLNFPTNGYLQGYLNLKQNEKNYIYSCWINSATSGLATITLLNSNGTTFSTQTFPFSSSSSSWNYYELKINTSGLSSSFTIKVTTNASIVIDDVLFYPQTADMNTYAFNPVTYLKTAETNTNGVSKYYSYDQYYRLQYVYDQDKNIVERKTYASVNSNVNGAISASFTYSPSSNITYGTVVSFTGISGSGACTPGANTSYVYNFGDGSSSPSSSSGNATHSYSQEGKYNVILTVSDPVFGIKTFSQTINVGLSVTTCVSGVYAYVAPTVYSYSQSCLSQSTDKTHSYFGITGTPGLPNGNTVSYQWQIAYTASGGSCGSSSWTTIPGATGALLTMPFSTSSFCPYNIQVIVTDNQTGVSTTIPSSITGFSVSNSLN